MNIDTIITFIKQYHTIENPYSHFLPIKENVLRSSLKEALMKPYKALYADQHSQCFTLIHIEKELHRIDIAGPVFDEKSIDIARGMLKDIQTDNPNMALYFFFPIQNTLIKTLLESVSAQRNDDEFILQLKRSNYRFNPLNHLKIIPKKDHQKLWDFHEEIFGETYLTPKHFFNDTSRHLYGYYTEGKLIGYGVIKDQSSTKRILEVLAINPQYRGFGHGKTLLKELTELGFKNQTIEILELVVESQNENALTLYKSVGFDIISHSLSYVINS